MSGEGDVVGSRVRVRGKGEERWVWGVGEQEGGSGQAVAFLG